MLVPLILGSTKDKEFAAKITKTLDEFGVPHKMIIASAHKVPEKVLAAIQEHDAKDSICYITVAGRSNALSGFVAANSIHPVIGCPPFADKVDMFVNIHSTLQMPSDTPVLTVIDPQNAAMAAIRILSVKDSGLRKKIKDHLLALKKSFDHA